MPVLTEPEVKPAAPKPAPERLLSVYVLPCLCGKTHYRHTKHEFECPHCGRILVNHWGEQ